MTVRRDGRYLGMVLQLALIDFSVGVIVDRFYMAKPLSLESLEMIPWEIISGSVGEIPLAICSATAWMVCLAWHRRPLMVGTLVGGASVAFMLVWVNMVLGQPPAPLATQILALALASSNGVYAAWRTRNRPLPGIEMRAAAPTQTV